MTHIVFTWELGDGYGHLAPYSAVIDALLARGDRVSFVARKPENAATVFAGRAVQIHAAPYHHAPAGRAIRIPNSYPQILFNCGFYSIDELTGRIDQWRRIFQSLAPDVIITDYSPTALVANRTLGVPGIISGIGFYVPPNLAPMPPLRYWLKSDKTALQKTEALVLDHINRALSAFATEPVASIADAHRTLDRFLLSFKEFDHYLDRTGDDYLGCFPLPSFGVAPRWPDASGPRVFAYLQNSAATRAVIDALVASGCRICLFAPGLDDEAIGVALESGLIERMTDPVALTIAAPACEMAVTNANISTLTAFALAGKPQLAVPTSVEKYLIGRRLELLGAGLSAPDRNPGDVPAKISALLTRRSYARAAEQFARRYAAKTLEGQTAQLLIRIDRLLGVAST